MVHLWYVRLDQPPASADRLGRLLPPEEWERIRATPLPEHRTRLLVARASLRSLLGAYLSIPADRVALRLRPGGKPELDGVPHGDLRFNLSHAREHALIAVTAGAEVGVDIECVRPVSHFDRVAGRVLTPGEARALSALPPELRIGAFIGCWTRKEAYAKARGAGVFRLGLRRVDLGFAEPSGPWRIVPDPAGAAQPYAVRSIEPPDPLCRAALAVEGEPRPIARFAWRPPR